jgi:hypothetical protein
MRPALLLATMPAYLLLPCRFSFAEEPKPTALCEVLNHQKDYLGKRLLVRGIVEQSEHARLLIASPKCGDGISAISLEGFHDGRAYFAAGGEVARGIRASVEGTIVMSDLHLYGGRPPTPEKQPPHLAFSADRVIYETSQSK